MKRIFSLSEYVVKIYSLERFFLFMSQKSLAHRWNKTAQFRSLICHFPQVAPLKHKL